MKKWIIGTVLLLCVASLSLAAPWKIGVVGPWQTEGGMWLKQAVEMAAEEINAQGGIRGRQLELIFQDDENKADKLTTAITRLAVREKVDFLVGGFSSGAVLGALENWARYKLIWLGTGAASPDVTQRVAEDYERFKYYFRVGTLDSVRQGMGIGNFIVDHVLPTYGVKKIAIISVDLVYAKQIAEAAAEICEANGMEIVYRDYFPMGTTDFSASFRKAEEAGAQIIIDAIVTDDGIQFTKQWYDLKVNAALIGAIAAALKPEFKEQTSGKCLYETSVYPNGGPAPLTTQTLDFVDRHVEKYGNFPGFVSFPAYNTLYVLKEALENVDDPDDKDQVIAALEQVRFPLGGDKGVAPVAFDENHDLVYGGQWANGIVFQWQSDGQWRAVWPDDYKTGTWEKPEWVEW
ncbi:MAG TPA: ABC transporter substrate-binding protein [Thermotogota bacterium]|nr:ABC transporter substrate-binding protein [Thermotogota bacterium]HRW92590.1 ABC transporter substrate-binding protein [Thermotogota bacterium]